MDPDPVSNLSSAVTPINEPRQACTVTSSPEITGLTGLVTDYTLSPKPANPTATSCATAVMTPSSSSSGHEHSDQFAAALASMRQSENEHRSVIFTKSRDDNPWSIVQRQPSSDDLEHYTFQSSPVAGGYPHRNNMSGQSSPRSGNSPGYFQPVSWQSLMPENLQSQKTTHDLQPKAISNYYQYSSAPFPPVSAHYQSQSFDSSDGASFPTRSLTDPYRDQYHSPPSEGVTSLPENCHSDSPCSSTLVFRADEDIMSPCPTSETGEDFAGSQYLGKIPSPAKSHDGSPPASPAGAGSGSGSASPSALPNTKNEEPYAQLIYRAFMSTKPRYAMTLQDIYQWFREHTDKGKSDNKGWQNSIRHNLSMNQAFTKSERNWGNGNTTDEAEDRPPANLSLSSSTHNSPTDNKKSTKWYLEPWAVTGGVESTTRYRKGNLSRRGGSSSRVSSTTGADAKRSAAYRVAQAMSSRSRGINKFRSRPDTVRLPLRNTSSGMQLHHYHPHSSHLQQPLPHQRQLPHLMHSILNDPYSSHFMTTAPPGMDYDFVTNSSSADSQQQQLYVRTPDQQQQQQQQQQHTLLHRAPSEPVPDEPVTPESASYNHLKGEPEAHLLPLHRAGLSTASTGTTSSSGAGPPGSAAAFHHYGGGSSSDHQELPGVGAFSLQGGGGGVMVGVYDEVADRYAWGGGSGAVAAAGAAGAGGVGHAGGVGGMHVDGLPYSAY